MAMRNSDSASCEFGIEQLGFETVAELLQCAVERCIEGQSGLEEGGTVKEQHQDRRDRVWGFRREEWPMERVTRAERVKVRRSGRQSVM